MSTQTSSSDQPTIESTPQVAKINSNDIEKLQELAGRTDLELVHNLETRVPHHLVISPLAGTDDQHIVYIDTTLQGNRMLTVCVDQCEAILLSHRDKLREVPELTVFWRASENVETISPNILNQLITKFSGLKPETEKKLPFISADEREASLNSLNGRLNAGRINVVILKNMRQTRGNITIATEAFRLESANYNLRQGGMNLRFKVSASVDEYYRDMESEKQSNSREH